MEDFYFDSLSLNPEPPTRLFLFILKNTSRSESSCVKLPRQYHLGDKDLLRVEDCMDDMELFAGRR